MTTIAQRRVAGATALMILLYLLQVALFAAPANADAPVECESLQGEPGANAGWAEFRFEFVNGTVVEGNNCPGSPYVLIDNGTRKMQEAIFPNTGGTSFPSTESMQVHVSCSDSFTDGWSSVGEPNATADSAWQIAQYSIERYRWAGSGDDFSLETDCSESATFFDVVVTPCTEPGTTDTVTVTLSSGYTVVITPVGGGDSVDVTTSGDVVLAPGDYTWGVHPTGEPEELVGANPFTVNACTTTTVASVSVGAECRDGVAYFLVNDLTNATLNVDLNGDGDFADTGETNVTTASEITAAAGTSIKWEATATGDAKFDGGLTVKTGTVTTPDCSTPTPSVSITHSSTCGQFSVTVTTDDIPEGWQYGVTVWVDGVEVDSNLVIGEGTDTITVNLPEDSSEGSATIVYYVSDATEWDLVPEDLDWQAAYTSEPTLETEGFKYRTVNVDTDCETPVITTTPQSQNVTVAVDGVCEVDGLGNGVGEFTVTITPANGATVTIDGTAVANGGSIVLDDDSSYAVTVVAAAGFTLVGGTPTASVGDCPEEPVEVLGTTITTVPEVSADTLPFTGFESGDTVKLGLLALLAGVLMLFAVRGPKEEEEIATEIGGWSSL